MSKLSFDQLLDAGVHFGHLKRKWNPSMAPYIFEEKKGIHIIDLNKTLVHLDQACSAMKQIAKSGKKVLFVATKKQAKDIVAEKISNVNMPFVTERWSGGMLTNFQTTRKSIRKMATIDKMKSDGSWDTLNKREKLFKTRQREKLEKTFGSISDMTRQPAAVFIVDILKEHIALAEARRLNIPTFAMVDTNSNPKLVDFPIPSNDDASKSISIIMDEICKAIQEGLEERKTLKDNPEKAKALEEEASNSAKVAENEVTEAKEEAPAEEEAPAKEESPVKEEKVSEAAAEVKEEEVKEEKAEKKPTAKKATAKKPAAKKATAKKPAAKKATAKKPAAKKEAAETEEGK
jgi:small subunit ribosomal protein S2